MYSIYFCSFLFFLFLVFFTPNSVFVVYVLLARLVWVKFPVTKTLSFAWLRFSYIFQILVMEFIWPAAAYADLPIITHKSTHFISINGYLVVHKISLHEILYFFLFIYYFCSGDKISKDIQDQNKNKKNYICTDCENPTNPRTLNERICTDIVAHRQKSTNTTDEYKIVRGYRENVGVCFCQSVPMFTNLRFIIGCGHNRTW